MLLVKTKVLPSDIHGLGLFVDQFVAKGSTVWEYRESFDTYLSDDFVQSLPDVARQAIEDTCDHDGNGWLVCADNSRFINHSDDANTDCIQEPGFLIANRPIYPGEEITQDYQKSCDLYHGFGGVSGKKAQQA